MQVVASEADARGRVVQVCKSQILVRRDLAAQPEEGLFGHLHPVSYTHLDVYKRQSVRSFFDF